MKRLYLERASQTVEEISFYPDFKIDEDAVSREIQLLGWRVYVTNKNQAQLSLKQAVRTYRDEYLTERGFARLKGFPLSLTPIYLQREDHVTGLIRLLSNGKASVDPFRISGSSPSGEKSRKACWTLCWQS
ncbi:MAG: hypothetical protein V7K64_27280 [Nostoc sp.]|uniref:hypothetical protein n=1 Tax=Nostoc sp. JL34 TaxID=2815397 RepID=UPI0025E5AE2E|nr:hypothetical protein [Nostoc sp. JL34]